MEDKKEIIKRLSDLLKITRAGEDIDTMNLSEDMESVEIVFNTGYARKVNIAMDSGISIIRDVTRAL